MLRCLANRILGQAGRAPRLILDHDACLVMAPRVIEQQRAMRRARRPVIGDDGATRLAPSAQKSSTVRRCQ